MADIGRVFDRWSSWWEKATASAGPVYDSVITRIPGPPGEVLDAGCGTGTLARKLLERRVAKSVWGLDISPGMLEKAKQLSANFTDSLNFVLADVESIPFESESFDVVVNTLSFHHYPQPAVSVGELSRVLKPQGTLLLADLDGGSPLIGVLFALNPLVRPFFGKEYRRTRGDVVEALEGSGLDVAEQVSVKWALPLRLYLAVKRGA